MGRTHRVDPDDGGLGSSRFARSSTSPDKPRPHCQRDTLGLAFARFGQPCGILHASAFLERNAGAYPSANRFSGLSDGYPDARATTAARWATVRGMPHVSGIQHLE
jgi:hypothetical protein